MRVTDTAGRSGYGGPVVHWWQNCLAYTGPAFDWRYEGIIIGYLTLWQRTRQQQWLEKATRAGDDLVRGQLPGGNYIASCFELNPYSGGTPHEAAASLGLLLLGQAVRARLDDRWQKYVSAAERNLRCFSLDRLWDEEAQSFRDQPDIPSLVPNKACTLAEALFVLAAIKRNDELIGRYALPTVDAVVELQVQAPARIAGAIPQDVQRGRVTHKYFPYYMARCVPALLLAHEHTNSQRYLDAAVDAMSFVARHLDADGLLPQAVFPLGVNRYPQWVAPLGDVLHAAELLAPYGLTGQFSAIETVLAEGQLPGGGIATGRGFGAQVGQKAQRQNVPDFRDRIAVTGWSDKVFRTFAGKLPLGQSIPKPTTTPFETACEIRGRRAVWAESETEMKLAAGGRTIYRWQKGQAWAETVLPEVMWK
jgi:hypothetical protein